MSKHDKNDLLRKKKDLTGKRSALHSDVSKLLDKSVEEKRGFTDDETRKHDQMMNDIEQQDMQIRSIESKLQVVNQEEADDASTAEQLRSGELTATRSALETDEYRSAFENFIRTGDSADLQDAKRNLSGIVATKGAELVPVEFFNQIEARIMEETSLLGLVNTRSIGSPTAKFAVKTGIAVAVPRGEGEAYGLKNGTYGQKEVNTYNLGHIAKVTDELLEDSFTNVQGDMIDEFGEAYALAAEAYGLLGSGAQTIFGHTNTSGKVPEGILNASGMNTHTTAGAGITLDDMIEIEEKVSSAVASRSSYLVNRTLRKALRLLKDTQGRPLWQPSVQAGRPALFNGYEVHTSDYMPALATGNKAILFGDFSRISMFLRKAMTIRRMDEKYSDEGMVGFRGQMRYDMVVRQPKAFVVGSIA